MRERESEAGFVLLSVLVIAGLIGATILALSLLARDDQSEIRLHLNLLRSKTYADNALVRSIAAIGNPSDPIHSLLLRYGEVHILAYDNVSVEVRVEPESGKIDLNRAPLGLIESAIRRIASDQSAADSLISRVLELRNSGNFITTPASILTTAQRFSSLRVAIERNFTVLSGATGILPDVAPPIVLASVLGRHLSADLQENDGASLREALLQEVTNNHAGNVSAGRPIYTVRAKVVDSRLPPLRRMAQFAIHQFPMSRQSDLSLVTWRNDSQR